MLSDPVNISNPGTAPTASQTHGQVLSVLVNRASQAMAAPLTRYKKLAKLAT